MKNNENQINPYFGKKYKKSVFDTLQANGSNNILIVRVSR